MNRVAIAAFSDCQLMVMIAINKATSDATINIPGPIDSDVG